jgi:translocator protein
MAFAFFIYVIVATFGSPSVAFLHRQNDSSNHLFTSTIALRKLPLEVKGCGTLISREKKSLLTHSLSASPLAWSACHVLGGLLGAPIVSKAIPRWYKKLDLPSWTPPNMVFGPVWTILYSVMGVAASRVYDRCQGNLSAPPMILWLFHYLVLNLSWAPVFFGMKRMRMGMLINSLNLLSLFAIIPMFYQKDALSGLLLIPYFFWITYATALNGAICLRNPTRLGYNEARFQDGLWKLQKRAAEYAGLNGYTY